MDAEIPNQFVQKASEEDDSSGALFDSPSLLIAGSAPDNSQHSMDGGFEHETWTDLINQLQPSRTKLDFDAVCDWTQSLDLTNYGSNDLSQDQPVDHTDRPSGTTSQSSASITVSDALSWS